MRFWKFIKDEIIKVLKGQKSHQEEKDENDKLKETKDLQNEDNQGLEDQTLPQQQNEISEEKPEGKEPSVDKDETLESQSDESPKEQLEDGESLDEVTQGQGEKNQDLDASSQSNQSSSTESISTSSTIPKLDESLSHELSEEEIEKSKNVPPSSSLESTVDNSTENIEQGSEVVFKDAPKQDMSCKEEDKQPLAYNDEGEQTGTKNNEQIQEKSFESQKQTDKEKTEQLDELKEENGIEDEKYILDEEEKKSLEESDELNNSQRLELLKKLKETLEKYSNQKKEEIEELRHQHERTRITGSAAETIESEEEEYTLSDQSNKFLEQLGELPSFKDRERSPGYSIDTKGYTAVPESVIRTLITKFLNQRFLKRNTDLNVRSNSMDKAHGFYKWEVKDVIIHLETEQITKALNDKYGYEYANGRNEMVPLSFYFDLSGSMSSYTNMLAVIAIELLKKGVKVLVGFNERVNVQIDKINGSITVEEFAKILSQAGYASWMKASNKGKLQKDSRVTLKFIDENIDNYLISRGAEKCVAFSDFDAIVELSNLSSAAQVYYFCFESEFEKGDLGDFKGFVYQVQNLKDIESGLVKVNDKRFETLCYLNKQKSLEKRLGDKK